MAAGSATSKLNNRNIARIPILAWAAGLLLPILFRIITWSPDKSYGEFFSWNPTLFLKIVPCALNRLTDQSSRRRTSSLETWLYRLAGDNNRDNLPLSIQILLEVFTVFASSMEKFFQPIESVPQRIC
jgi:hypothetical protein